MRIASKALMVKITVISIKFQGAKCIKSIQRHQQAMDLKQNISGQIVLSTWDKEISKKGFFYLHKSDLSQNKRK